IRVDGSAMNRNFVFFSLLTMGLGFNCAAQLDVSAPGTPAGNLQGTARTSEELPVGAATVIAGNLGDGSNRVGPSAPDGSFSVSDLKSGRYLLTAEKDGAGVAGGSTADLGPEQSVSADGTLSAVGGLAVKPDVPAGGGFFRRFFKAYTD